MLKKSWINPLKPEMKLEQQKTKLMLIPHSLFGLVHAHEIKSAFFDYFSMILFDAVEIKNFWRAIFYQLMFPISKSDFLLLSITVQLYKLPSLYFLTHQRRAACGYHLSFCVRFFLAFRECISEASQQFNFSCVRKWKKLCKKRCTRETTQNWVMRALE